MTPTPSEPGEPLPAAPLKRSAEISVGSHTPEIAPEISMYFNSATGPGGELLRNHARALAGEHSASVRLARSGPEAVLAWDMDYRILYWSKGAERLYGWTAAGVKGAAVTDLFYQERIGFESARQGVLRDGEWNGHMRQVTISGKDLNIHSRWTLVRDMQGQPRFIVVINSIVSGPPLR